MRQASARRLPRSSFGYAAVAGAASVVRQAAPASAEVTSVKTAKEKVEDLLKENEVIMFSKSTCPFCARAKTVLESEGRPFTVMELDELPAENMANMQDALAELTGARTVPRVFINGQCVGGCDDVVSLKQSGELSKLLGGRSGSFVLEKSEADWQSQLSSAQYTVLRRKGTEPPGSHEYNNFLPTKGYFACGACGLPLYSASSKFASNCGWPVFDKCYYSEEAKGCHVGTVPEFGGLEIVCNRCESHLGHVFFDAFKPSNPNGERH